MIRRVGAALASALLLALLAGCVGLPTSGGVAEHRLRGGDDLPNVNFVARAPAKGDSQEDILTGFVQAGIDTRDRYRVAREFLAPDLAAKWNPSASVLVTDGSRNDVTRTGANALSLSVHVDASVDATGVYTDQDQTTSLGFEFTKVKGQWRISQAPDGTILRPANFTVVFNAYPLYFYDPTLRYLVPDLRWFPSGTGTADRIVRALLAGPDPWFGSTAVVSAFPKDTSVSSDGIAIDGGVATVDLSSEVLGQNNAARRRMTYQLKASLAAAATISSVRMTVRGYPVDVTDSGDPAPIVDPQIASLPVGATSTAVGSVGASGVRELAGLSDRILALSPRSGTLDPTQTTAVVLSSGGVYRVTANAESALIDRRAGQITPTIDASGTVFTAQSSGSDTIVTTDDAGTSRALPVATPADGTLTAMRLSRDGTRLAMLVTTDEGPVIEVAAVQRSGSTPSGLGAVKSIRVDGDPLDLAWSDDATLAVLERGDSGVEVVSQQIGGRSAPLGSPTGGVQLVGGNGGSDGVRVLSSDGTILQQTGAGAWSATGATGVRFLFVQQ